MFDFKSQEYQYKQYQRLLANWDYMFAQRWKSSHRYFDEQEIKLIEDSELPTSSMIAKRIYITLNTEKRSAEYLEMLGNLSSRSAQELEEAEKLLPEFTKFITDNNLDGEQTLRLKTVFPHIVGCFTILKREEKDFPSFTEFLIPLNNILQNLEQTQYNNQTRTFANYLFDQENIKPNKNITAFKLQLLKHASKKTNNCSILNHLCNDFRCYFRVFPETINSEFLNNYINYIIPRFVKGNDIFGIQSNKWGCARGKGIACGVGAATYAYKCYATRITPCGINDLLQMSYEVLGGNLSKHEKIRKDALLLNKWFPRDPIHDSTPGVNEIINKMVAYYDAPEDQKDVALSELTKVGQRINMWKTIYDLPKYDEISSRSNEKHIDILRRIKNNMSQNNVEVPITENDEINFLAQKANKKDHPTLSSMLPLIQALNHTMLEAIDKKQTGFSPEMVNMIAWADRQLAQAVNNMDFEKQMGFYKENDCKCVLLFSELTHSAKEEFNCQEFDDFYEHKVKQAFDMEQAYINIANRQNQNLLGLYDQYDRYCHAMDDTDNAKTMILARKERAGSGNTLKALQNLTLYKEPSTMVGKREKAEREKRFPYRDFLMRPSSNQR